MTNTPHSTESDALSARRAVWDAARTHAFETYLAALLAPKDVRDDLVVLAAFLGEAARIPFLVSEPTLGDIRIQWWRDWLALVEPQSAPTGNVLADAFGDVIARHDLAKDRIGLLLDARADEGYAGDFADDAVYRQHLTATTGTGFSLAARIAGLEETPDVLALMAAATEAVGTVAIIKRLPQFVARGRWPLPIGIEVKAQLRDNSPSMEDFLHDAAVERQASVTAAVARARRALGQAKALNSQVSGGVRSVVIELALVEPYLRVLQSSSNDPSRIAPEISPLVRVWRLWWAKRRGRF